MHQIQRPSTGQRQLPLELNNIVSTEGHGSRSTVLGNHSMTKSFNMYRQKNQCENNVVFLSNIKKKQDVDQQNKKVPKNIHYDKETLYDQNIKFKNQINKLNEDIRRSKIENENLERTVKHYEQIIELKDKRMMSRQQESKSPVIVIEQSNHTSIINLKHQIKDYQQQLNVKINELMQLKKNTRTTQYQELEVENIQLKEEIKRLMNIIKVKVKQEQNDYRIINQTLENSNIENLQMNHMQKNLINAYKEDNINLSNMIQTLETENINLNKKLKHLEHDLEKANQKTIQSEKQVKELNKQLINLREDFNSNNGNSRKLSQKQEIQHLKQILEGKQEEIKILNGTSMELKRQNRELEIKYKEFENESNMIRNLDAREKDKLLERINLLHRENERLEQLQNELKASDDEQHPPELNSRGKDSILNESSFRILTNRNSNTSIPKKRLPKVNNYDVYKIGKELKLNLMIQMNDFSEMENLIISQSNPIDNDIAISEICMALQEQPFMMNDLDNITLVARYLVEDNMEDFILYDPNRVQEKTIVKSVFKKLIGEYKLFTEQEFMQIELQCASILSKWRSSIDSTLKQLTLKKKHLNPGTCEFNDWDAAIEFCDIQISQRIKEYLELEVYKQSKQVDLINYSTILQHFDQIHKNYVALQQKLEEERQALEEIEKYKILQQEQSRKLQEISQLENQEQQRISQDQPYLENEEDYQQLEKQEDQQQFEKEEEQNYLDNDNDHQQSQILELADVQKFHDNEQNIDEEQ